MNKSRFNKLLKQSKFGDKKAIEELYQELHSAIFTTAFFYLKNREDAEDITEEVFWKIWTYEGKPVQEPAAWIKRIVRNDCYNYLKREDRVVAVEDVDEYGVSGDTNLPTDELLILKEILACCDEVEQSILIDHVFWKHTLIKISEDLGVSYPTIKRKYKVVKEKLKNFLKS